MEKVSRDAVLELPPPEGKDQLGGYYQTRLDSIKGYKLALYTWIPPCGVENATAVLFLVHGVFAHVPFEFLSSDENNHRTLLKDSIVEKILDLGVVVIAHDHPGHGRSSGLHAFVDTHDDLRDAAIHVVEHSMAKDAYAGKKVFMLGESMGGTTAIRICETRPDLVDAYVLLAPAVRPPDDMFGWQGRFLKLISPILAATVPKLPVLALPPSPDPKIRDAVEKDGLIYRGGMRVRMGTEFLRIYSEIDERASQLTFKSVGVFIGGKDIIVSPTGIKEFVERIQGEDKDMFVFDNLGHEVAREEGCEVAIEQIVNWIADRVPDA